MLSPIRFVGLLRPKVRAAVIASVVTATFAFTSTPFLLGLVAEHYGTGLTITSFVSTAQLLGFSIGSFGAGRVLSPSRRVFVIASIGVVIANLVSAIVPPFLLLVALRFLGGLAMGVVSWYGWSLVFGQTKRTAEMSTIGPLAGIFASPIVAPAADLGIGPVFLVVAAAGLLPLMFAGSLDGATSARRPGYHDRHAPVVEAMVILAALGFFTAGGSSLFTYSVVIGKGVGADASMVALAYSANSLFGVIGARWPWSRGPAGLAMALTGLMALLMGGGISESVFIGSIAVWGLLFWIGIPAAFDLLARKSRFPEERAGDAQSVMAMGRVVGPFVGGLMLDTVGVVALSVLAAAVMIGAGSTLLMIQRRD